MTTETHRKAAEQLISYLKDVKQKLDDVTHTNRQLELTTPEVIELTYISQRIDYYLKMFAGKREPRSNT